jgi:hypothetical protein
MARDNELWAKHGKYGTPVYVSWFQMLTRCRNPRCPEYENYGGRGISVCERWLDFRNFYADMGDRHQGMSLDRINNSRGYEPGNCRWATRGQQNNNKRSNIVLTHNGESLTLAQWAQRLGMKQHTIQARHRRGLPPEKVLQPSALGKNQWM